MYFMYFHNIYGHEKSNDVDISLAENWENYVKKTLQKWKIKQFSKKFKIVNSVQNHLLSIGKKAIECFNPNPKHEENPQCK